MALILITGLDGSGKSSLLTRLEKNLPGNIDFLRVPKVDTYKYRSNEALEKAGCFINEMGILADEKKDPNIKIISLFSSMILFQDFLEELLKSGSENVFCERHPLIDTVVYAKAYIGALDPEHFSRKTAQYIQTKYPAEIEFISKLLSPNVKIQNNDFCLGLLGFLRDWFSFEKNYTLHRMSELFRTPLPDEVYLLDASPEILVKRIGERDTREYHETLEIISRIQALYPWILNQMGSSFERIDTNTWDDVEELYTSFCRRFKSSSSRI